MKVERTAEEFLRDIVIWGERALSHIEGLSPGDFLDDAKTQDAVSKCVEAIGEAAHRAALLDPMISELYPDLDIRIAYRTRNKLSHHYFDTDQVVLSETVEDFVPVYVARVRDILRQCAVKTV